jgi:hypothetical protein
MAHLRPDWAQLSLRHQRWLGSQEARIAKMKELGLEPIARAADDGPEDIRRAAS